MKTRVGSGWKHERVTLKPCSTDKSFEPLVFEEASGGELRVIAEFVVVLAR